jgi:hypothetical protein
MRTLKEIKSSLKDAKESKISSWIDEVSREYDRALRFFELASELGLVVDGSYVSGIPKGEESKVNEFYTLEDKLDYPQPQKLPKQLNR